MSTGLERTVRHELRNHLNNISVNAELIKLLIEGGSDNERLKKCIDTVIVECKHCSHIINEDGQQ